MNFSALNGESINGTGVAPIVNADAAALASASIVAAATRTQDALAPGAGVADVSASPTRTTFAFADSAGEANGYPSPTQTIAISATVVCSADITAYVLRIVAAGVSLYGTAEFSAIPASLLGSANVAGSAILLAPATQISPGASTMTATGGVVAEGQCFRMSQTTISGAATVRPEAANNNQVDGFCGVTASAEVGITDSGIKFNIALANVDCTAIASGAGQLNFAGAATLIGDAGVTAAAVTVLAGVAAVSSAGAVTASATRTVLPEAGVVAGCIITGTSRQNHASGSGISGWADIVPIGTAYRGANVAITTSVEVAPGAIVRHPGIVLISGGAGLIAEGRSNADAKDPEERTARRPFVDTAMRRPYTETTMRRAA